MLIRLIFYWLNYLQNSNYTFITHFILVSVFRIWDHNMVLFSPLPLSLPPPVFVFGYIWVQGPMHAEARVVWSSVAFRLTFWVRVSHWVWNWKFPPGWQTSDLPGSTCLYLPKAKVIATHYHAWLFYMGVEDLNWALLLLQQALLTTESSPEPANIFLVFLFPFQSLFIGNSSGKIIAGSTFS